MPTAKAKICAKATKPAAKELEMWDFRLSVVGQNPKSIHSFENLKKQCEEHLPGLYQIQVIDLRKHLQLAQGDSMVAIPTLVRRLPEPFRTVIGDVSNNIRLLAG